MSALENLSPYPTQHEIFLAALADGYTPAAADAYAVELDTINLEEWDIQQAGEIWAENAWLRHAESAGFDESQLEADYERSLGVVPFSEAYAANL